jgi:hypothetical protein
MPLVISDDTLCHHVPVVMGDGCPREATEWL